MFAASFHSEHSRRWATIPLLVASFAARTCAQTVDASTLHGKVIWGYQGWFRAPNEPGSSGNIHWSTSGTVIDESTIVFDTWPDVSQYPAECLFDTNFKFANGTTAQLYTNTCEGVADLHFRWMQENSLDGVFEQRFFGDATSGDTTWATVFNLTRQKSEEYGRVFAVQYDISDATTSDDILSVLQADWENFVLPLTESPQYLRENGKPVLSIWGPGIGPATPDQLQPLFEYFVDTAGVYLVLGVIPEFFWQTDYLPVFNMANSLNPWHGAVVDGMAYVQGTDITYGIGYATGYSAHNLQTNEYANGATFPTNQCPRNGGQFFQLQVNQSLIDKPYWAFAAMFDEFEESTNGIPFLNKADLPVTQSVNFVARDADGVEVSPTFYLELGGQASASLKSALGVTN